MSPVLAFLALSLVLTQARTSHSMAMLEALAGDSQPLRYAKVRVWCSSSKSQ